MFDERIALLDQSSDNKKPTNWKEAWSSNIEEFRDHWNDFFADIYRNKDNSVLDVILLSVELPFTIVRKVCSDSAKVVPFLCLCVLSCISYHFPLSS